MDRFARLNLYLSDQSPTSVLGAMQSINFSLVIGATTVWTGSDWSPNNVLVPPTSW